MERENTGQRKIASASGIPTAPRNAHRFLPRPPLISGTTFAAAPQASRIYPPRAKIA
jgi:hypothetical protein